jgi:hypothetical protein
MMRLLWTVAVVGLLAGLSFGASSGDEEPTAKLNFIVVKDYNGKPIKNASVVLHPVTSKGKQERGGYELKTNEEGKTQFDGAPYGTLRVQVLAPGFQTFGQDYEIQKPEVEITIKLKRPTKQYSIYGDSSNAPKDPPKEERPQ